MKLPLKTTSPLERLTAALPAELASEEQLVHVVAGDVVKLATSLPPERQTETTRALLQGASSEKPDRKVHQKALDLAHLIAQAEPPEPPPEPS